VLNTNSAATIIAMVCYLGDPRQLPATIKSKPAAKRGYEISLFERLERAGHPIHLLNVQVLHAVYNNLS
jgi:hypothetical protein